MANGDLALYKALQIGRPWVLGIQNQVVSYCGVGICDPLLQNSVSALEPFRYATVLFRWSLVGTVVPGGAPLPDNNDGDNLRIPTGQQQLAFTTGVNEPIPGGWWIQTIADTDLLRQGAPIDLGFMFLITGLAINALDPFQRGGTGASTADPRFYSNWLQQSNNGPGYSFQLQKAVLNYVGIEISFGDTGCSYRVGVAGFYPTWGDPAGPQTVRNGLVSQPGMYMPFTTAICAGSRDDVRQLTITLTFGQACEVQNNPAQPTIAGSAPATVGSINAANQGDVFVPLRVATLGYIVCVPATAYCGIPTLTPDEVVLLRQRMGLVPVGAPGIPGVVPAPAPLPAPAGYPGY